MKFQAVLAALMAATASAAPGIELRSPLGKPNSPYRRVVRTAGSGPAGLLTKDESASYWASHTANDFKAASASNDFVVLDNNPANGAYSGACLNTTTATVQNCKAVVEDVLAREGNNTIAVAPGFCYNWWEGAANAGGCLGRICGVDKVIYTNATWLATTMVDKLVDTCISEGKRGVVADCADYGEDCGTYRVWMEEYTGKFDKQFSQGNGLSGRGL